MLGYGVVISKDLKNGLNSEDLVEVIEQISNTELVVRKTSTTELVKKNEDVIVDMKNIANLCQHNATPRVLKQLIPAINLYVNNFINSIQKDIKCDIDIANTNKIFTTPSNINLLNIGFNIIIH